MRFDGQRLYRFANNTIKPNKNIETKMIPAIHGSLSPKLESGPFSASKLTAVIGLILLIGLRQKSNACEVD
jgi:hypothetical protein